MRLGITTLVVAASLAAALAASSTALAGGRYYHGGPRVGVTIGYGWGPRPYWGPGWGPYWGPRYYYPPPVFYSPPPAFYGPPIVYAPPAVVVRPAPPPVYIEREDTLPAPAAAPEQWWYFCRSTNAYYPYARECPEGWQRVPPQPPPPG